MTLIGCILLIATSFSSVAVSFSNGINEFEEKTLNVLNVDYENDVKERESKTQFTYDPTSESLSFTINIPEPNLKIISIHGVIFTEVTIPGLLSFGESGKPSLPISTTRILLPPETVVDEIKVVEVATKKVDVRQMGFDLVKNPVNPAQPPIPIGTPPPSELIMNQEIYSSDSPVYSQEYSNQGVHYCRGYEILHLSTYPVEYIPKKGVLYHTKEMMFEIKLKPIPTNQFFRPNNREDRKWVESLVNNPDMAKLYETINFINNDYLDGLCEPSDNNGRGYDYVIIVREALVDFPRDPPLIKYNWSDLITRKKQQELETIKVTVEDILACSEYWNTTDPLYNDTPAIIREFCRDAYLDWGTQYLLIAGDCDDFHPETKIERRLMMGYLQSDIYWTHLDKTFNDDHDDKWGEYGDPGFDAYSEMYSGSLPCDEPQDVSNWLTKSFFYDDSKESDYLENAAFYGGELGWQPEGDGVIDYSAVKGSDDWFGPDPHHAGPYPDWLGFQYGFETWNNTRPDQEFNLSVKWSATDPNPGWQGETTEEAIQGLKDAINNDHCTLISGIAHANALLSLDVYASSWESEYHNTKPFFITDQGCMCGDMIGADDGVLHAMLFHSDTELAFACIYNTGYGWGMSGTTNASSSLMMKSFWDYFFDTVNNSGSILNWQLGKGQEWARDLLAATIHWDFVFQYTMECNLLFGDPAQKIKPPLLQEHNIGVLSISVPEHVKSNEKIQVSTTIFNDGQNDETNVTVNFLVDGVQLDTKLVPLLKNQTTMDLFFSWLPQSAGTYLLAINVSLPSSIEEGLYEDNIKNKTVLAGVLNKDTGELFDTIQQAIDDPETFNGHLILVPPGVYRENVLISKAISLDGEGEGITIIDGNRRVISVSSDDVFLTGFTIRNGTNGIHIRSSENVVISHNEICNNRIGIYITDSSNNNEIIFNDIHNNSLQIVNDIPENISTVNKTKYQPIPYDDTSLQKFSLLLGGIVFENTYDNIVSRNTFTNNRIGLIIKSGENIVITKNELKHNYIGITINNGNSNIVTNNEFKSNKKGLIIRHYGNSNLIYNNNFNNTLNAVDNGENNQWENGYCYFGNWWSDYSGTDEFRGPNQDINGSDGVGDTSYLIPGESNSTDRYPLMEPYTGFVGLVINLDTYKLYDEIQKAIDDNDTLDGHTLFVRNSVYYENIVINKTITLIGEDRETTIIDGDENGNGITITANQVNISGFTIRNCGNGTQVLSNSNRIANNNIIFTDYALHLFSSSNNSVSGNTISNNDYGIYLSDASNNILTENNIVDNGASIQLVLSSNNIISRNVLDDDFSGILIGLGYDNIIMDNVIRDNEFYGIYIIESVNLTIRNNSFISCGIIIDWEVYGFSHFDSLEIENNTINDRYIRYYKNLRDIIVPSDTGQLILHNCTNFTIQNLNLSNAGVGLFLDCSSNNMISKNIFNYNNLASMMVLDSHHNTIYYNTVDSFDNEYGCGIILWESSNNNITRNIITDFYQDALFLVDSCNNTILENYIIKNDNGIRMLNSDNNVIYHNNFINNSRHIIYVQGSHIWDNGYPSGGNYWDDFDEPSEGAFDNYSGVNQDILGSDGIVDLGPPEGGLNPYIIDSNNQDNYPLIQPYNWWKIIEITEISGNINVDNITPITPP